ncbi:MAG: glycosyltransferase family 4 protein [Desulfuromonadales bacterium]
MKVVQLLPELNEGGVERGVVELNREFVKRGIESVVISAGGRQASQIGADGGHHICLDVAAKNPLTAWQRVRLLRKQFDHLQPDVIHARSRAPAWLSYLANRHQRPFVTTVHGFNSVNRYSRIMTQGDRVICVSGAIRDFVIKHYQVPEDRLVVIPRGIDLELFNPDRLDQEFMADFKKRYDLEEKCVVTTVGRITQLKDLETFIAAVIELKRQLPKVVGLIVGGVHEHKKDYYRILQGLVAEHNAEQYIHFTGSQNKVAEIYALTDVVVSSSKKPESFGRSAAEALAMNVPVAASSHGGMLDIVLPGQTGQLFNPGDVSGLTKGIVACQNLPRESLRTFVQEKLLRSV